MSKLFFWKKKQGDIHIGGHSNTYCGLPMLGNNYATQKEQFATCAKCVEVMEQKENNLSEDEVRDLIVNQTNELYKLSEAVSKGLKKSGLDNKYLSNKLQGLIQVAQHIQGQLKD